MKSRRVLTAMLLVFVALSTVKLVAKRRSAGQGDKGLDAPASAAPRGTAGSAVSGRTVIVYYSHGHARCAACERIEAYSHEALETHFGSELASGRVRWLAVDFDEPGHRHFQTEFNLVAPALVLVEREGDVQLRSKSLPEVMDLIRRSEKPAFLQYVREQVRVFLAGSGDQP